MNANNQVAGALEWLPQLNSGAGGLAFADTGGVIVSNASVTSWSRQLDAPSGPYHQSAAAANAFGAARHRCRRGRRPGRPGASDAASARPRPAPR